MIIVSSAGAGSSYSTPTILQRGGSSHQSHMSASRALSTMASPASSAVGTAKQPIVLTTVAGQHQQMHHGMATAAGTSGMGSMLPTGKSYAPGTG